MHFFTEHNKLGAETNAYGPVNASETAKYNVTSRLALTDLAKAFACQTGRIIVVPSQSSAGLVNVILKPDGGLRIPFSKIEYYIYRGLLKSTFVTGDFIKDDDDDNTDFITNLWKKDSKFKDSFPEEGNPDPSSFGLFSPPLPGTLNVDLLFKGLDAPNNEKLQYNYVKEGEWISNFEGSCGFEIITETENQIIDLDYVSKSNHAVDISGMPTGTNEEKFKLKSEREKVLNYIDPAAFWGLHYDIGIDVFDLTNANRKIKIKKGNLYTSIISKYSTKNKVYLDIRSEYGYSYNYYQNYADDTPGKSNLKFKTDKDHPFLSHRFDERDWPIFDQTSILEFNTYGSLIFQLRVDDNTKPLIFSQDHKILPKSKKKCFLNDQELLDGSSTGWTKDIELRFPNISDSGMSDFISTYLKIQYFRQNNNPASPTTVLSNPSNTPIKLKLPKNELFSKLNHLRIGKRAFINGNSYSFVLENGLFRDDTKVILYAKNVFSYLRSNDYYARFDFSQPIEKIINSSILPKNIVFSKWKVTTTLDIIEMVGYNEDSRPTHREDIFYLGLLKSEYENLQNLAGLSALHSKLIVFKKDPNPQIDAINNMHYQKYSIELLGLNEAGISTKIIPANDLIVYGSGRGMLCSNSFANIVNLPNRLLPDPGLMREWRFGFVGKVTIKNNKIIRVKDNDPILANVENHPLTLDAILRFPTDSKNVTDLGNNNSNISSRSNKYPLVVITHGNGQDYKAYDKLSTYLAANGFIVLSVDCRRFLERKITKKQGNKRFFISGKKEYYLKITDSKIYLSSDDRTTGVSGKELPSNSVLVKQRVHGFGSLGRAKITLEHLKNLDENLFLGNKAQFDNIGLIGHSRGGEAVLKIAKLLENNSTYTIKSIISLAPTDLYNFEELTQDIPYFVLYGSRDGDVTGLPNPQIHNSKTRNRTGGFSLYDRAENKKEKSMAFVYGATHNGFITKNSDDPKTKKPLNPIPETIQYCITKAYMNAFLRMTLKGESGWLPLFTGSFKPKSIVFPEKKGEKKGGIFMQYRHQTNFRRVIDDFEGALKDWKQSSVGGLSVGGLVEYTSSDPKEDALQLIDKYSPHDTQGLKIKWKANDILTFNILDSDKDVSNFGFISFRICKVYKSTSSISDLRVLLKGKDGIGSYIFVNDMFLGEGFKIPNPDIRIDQELLTKSALMTVRIPLQEYSAGQVDLSIISQLWFVFPKNGKGEVEIDSIEFTN